MLGEGDCIDGRYRIYGEKVKAYLRKGAKQLAGYERWPNALLGYGALCVRDSLPGLGSS